MFDNFYTLIFIPSLSKFPCRVLECFCNACNTVATRFCNGLWNAVKPLFVMVCGEFERFWVLPSLFVPFHSTKEMVADRKSRYFFRAIFTFPIASSFFRWGIKGEKKKSKLAGKRKNCSIPPIWSSKEKKSERKKIKISFF